MNRWAGRTQEILITDEGSTPSAMAWQGLQKCQNYQTLGSTMNLPTRTQHPWIQSRNNSQIQNHPDPEHSQQLGKAMGTSQWHCRHELSTSLPSRGLCAQLRLPPLRKTRLGMKSQRKTRAVTGLFLFTQGSFKNLRLNFLLLPVVRAVLTNGCNGDYMNQTHQAATPKKLHDSNMWEKKDREKADFWSPVSLESDPWFTDGGIQWTLRKTALMRHGELSQAWGRKQWRRNVFKHIG